MLYALLALGRIRPDHFYRIHRHGPMGCAGIPAGAAGGLCEAGSSARIHAPAEPAQTIARRRAWTRGTSRHVFRAGLSPVRNSLLRAGGGRRRTRDSAARGGAVSAYPGQIPLHRRTSIHQCQGPLHGTDGDGSRIRHSGHQRQRCARDAGLSALGGAAVRG